MNINRLWVALLCVAFAVSESVAQTEQFVSGTQFRFGGGIFSGLYFHSSSFAGLPGVPTCCPKYEQGTGIGFSGAAFFQKPLNSMLSLSLWGGVSDVPARFSATEEKQVVVENTIQTALIEHQLTTNVLSLYFETQLAARFSVVFSGFIGLRGDFFATSSYRGREELLRPETGSFETGSRIRNETTGALPGVNRGSISPVAGVRFDVPLNAEKSIILMPEVAFFVSISDIVGFTPWSVAGVRAGASVALEFEKTTEILEE